MEKVKTVCSKRFQVLAFNKRIIIFQCSLIQIAICVLTYQLAPIIGDLRGDFAAANKMSIKIMHPLSSFFDT